MKKIFKFYIWLLLMVFATATYAQNANSVYNYQLDNYIQNGQKELAVDFIEKSEAPAYKMVTIPLLNRAQAYAYVAYDPSSALPEGPAAFDTDDPNSLTSLSATTSADFIAGGTWAEDTWYGVEYGTGVLYTISEVDGSMTYIGGGGTGLNGLAYDGSTMYGCSSTDLYIVDPSTGGQTYVGSMGSAGGVMIALAHDGTTLYGFDLGDDMLYSIDPSTGAATVIGSLGINMNYAQDAEYDMENNVLYLAGYTTAGELYSVDPSTGAATYIGAFPGGCEMTAMAVPFTGVTYTNDIGIQAITTPASGPDLGNAEVVTVRIKNYGTATQSNFDVSYSLDGGAAVTETFTGSLAGGETALHEFGPTVDLSSYGVYAFEACTYLAGDENTGNDCKPKNVENYAPAYCVTSYTNQTDDWISNVTFGDISNPSGSEGGGYADYTEYSTDVSAGSSYDITVEITVNGDWLQYSKVWIDWNQNYSFTDPGEEYDLGVTPGTTGVFDLTGTIDVPADALNGATTMRVAERYAQAPGPCDEATYGEAEDYTVTVGGGGSTLDPPQNLTAEFQSPNNIYLDWDDLGGGGGNIAEWIQWDDGTNGNSIGLTDGGTFFIGSHWQPADLTAYDGAYITELSFFAGDYPGATFTMKVWSGANAGTELYSEAFGTYVQNDWNTHTLSTPVMIDASQELWFGYEVTHGAGEFPAGTDLGPAIANNGDMISLDGSSWESMSISYGLNYNWNMAAFVTDETDGEIARPLVKQVIENPATPNFAVVEQIEEVADFNPTISRDFLGYNIYRNGSMIMYVTASEYLDEDLAPGSYEYCVTGVYDEGESDCSNSASAFVPGSAGDPPQNLVATADGDDAIQVTWQAPGSNPVDEWIHWDDGTNGNSIGLTDGGTFFIGSHWNPADLTAYNGAYITELSFFAGDYPGATFTLKVWSGANAGTELYSEAYGTYVQNDWNTHTLSTPVMIDASQELWFGYEVTHGAGEFPAGTDLGPAIANNGDMISLDGSSWESMSISYGLNYNWNMQAHVTNTTDLPLAKPLVKQIIENPSAPNFSIVQQTENVSAFNPMRDVLGYKLYRDGTFLVETGATVTSYLDEDLTPGEYCYFATALYTDGESTPSNTDCEVVGVSLDPPTNLTVTADGDCANLSWMAPGGGGGDDFFEDFESGTLPTGWQAVDNDGDGFNWINVAEQGFGFDTYAGTGAMTSASYDNDAGALTPDNYLITPAINLGAGATMTWWHDAQDPAWADDFYYVKLSTTGTDLDDFTEILWSGTTPTDWAQVSVDLSAYSGQVYLAFQHTECTDWFWMKIDDVAVSGTTTRAQFTPAIAQVENQGMPFRTSGMTQDEISNAYNEYLNNMSSTRALTGYNVYYEDGTFIDYVTGTSYQDCGLAPGEYCYYVTAVYDEGESVPSNTNCCNIEPQTFEPIVDNFDEYTSGDQLVCQGAPFWTTWSDNPCSAEDPYVTSDEYYSAGNSVVIEGTNDLVMPYPNYITGEYGVQFMIFVPTGFQGYFNTLSLFAGTASNWAMQAYFDLDGFGTADAGGEGAGSFFYSNDTWVPVRVIADLDNDLGKLFVGDMDNSVVEWQWSTGAFGEDDLLQLGGSNFYAWSEGASPLYYIDNFQFDYPGNLDPIGIEDINTGSFNSIYPNPATDVVNVASDVNITNVKVFNFAGQLISNENVNTKFHVVNTSDLDSGVYIFTVETEQGITNQRVIIE